MTQTSASVAPEPGEFTPQPILKGLRLFVCAHSFHNFIPAILSELANTSGLEDQQFVGMSMIGGSRVIQHWDVAEDENKAKETLRAGEVDVLTLSPIWLPDDGIEEFARLAFKHNPNVRVTVLEFWLPNDTFDTSYPLKTNLKVDHNAATPARLRAQHALYFQEMDNLIGGLNKVFGKQTVLAVPAGQAALALREKIIVGEAPGLASQEDLFIDSWGHPSTPLKLLSAYCHYAVFYRKSPVGLPAPEILATMPLQSGDAQALNKLLQKLAWDAVLHHPLSGIVN